MKIVRQTSRVIDDQGRDDVVLPFAVESLHVRGRVVRLGKCLDQILGRHAYPVSVARLLGEAITLTSLLGSSLKISGRFQLQTRTDGIVDMIVVDYTLPDQLRGYARFNEERFAAELQANSMRLLGKGHLAFTIDQGSPGSRYQGIVTLDGLGFEAAADEYFAQSEQIPTFVRLAVAENITSEGSKWRSGGLLLQFLPSSEDRERLEGKNLPESSLKDFWLEAKAHAQTLGDDELCDPILSSERLLYRLFHERGVVVFSSQNVKDQCRCSDENVLAMLNGFSIEERNHMVGDDGKIGVTCEFCSTHRSFDPSELDSKSPDKSEI